ncbi:cbb3-type cytochrome c oxidase subunit 3 [bacterium]|nr:cbb3-type cytochrome c oxidase subunit 3 [bacterium]
MDAVTGYGIFLVLLITAFILMVVRTFSAKHKSKYDDASQMPFADSDTENEVRQQQSKSN